MEAYIKAICISENKGTVKHPVESAELKTDWGIVGDAHAGAHHRQISLLSLESIEAFRKKGASVDFGDFGENLVTVGLDLKSAVVGSTVRAGECILKISQLGKECHSHCAIYEQTGDCIMPREGIFATVTKGGRLSVGDRSELIPPADDRPFTAAVITLSDRCFNGEREDRSTPVVTEMLKQNGYEVVTAILLPDGREKLERALTDLSDRRQVNLIFTTGGTGFSERDLTPEATKAVSEREAPGIGEALRSYSMSITPKAMFSRQTAGIRGKTLIINLPGSPKACREELEFLLPHLTHGLGILRGTETD